MLGGWLLHTFLSVMRASVSRRFFSHASVSSCDVNVRGSGSNILASSQVTKTSVMLSKQQHETNLDDRTSNCDLLLYRTYLSCSSAAWSWCCRLVISCCSSCRIKSKKLFLLPAKIKSKLRLKHEDCLVTSRFGLGSTGLFEHVFHRQEKKFGLAINGRHRWHRGDVEAERMYLASWRAISFSVFNFLSALIRYCIHVVYSY